MSLPVALEPAVRLSPLRALTARCAVGVARLLVRLAPRRLRAALRFLSRGARPATVPEAAAARQAVVSVSVRCAGQGCLQRSVAAALLCRMRGSWPEWCTGVRTQPFRAHAWIAVDGIPVGENAEVPLFRTHMRVAVPPRAVPSGSSLPGAVRRGRRGE